MRSSVLRPSAWSILTDISLADISIIAVMSLPVRFHELSNGAWYGAGTVQADSEDTHSNPEALAMDQFLEDIADDGGPRSDVNYILDRTPNDSEDEIFICHVSNDVGPVHRLRYSHANLWVLVDDRRDRIPFR